MRFELRHIGIATVFVIWVLPRVLPLIIYPGVYCFDTWFYMSYARSILAWNRIPPLNPLEYWYIPHSALYLFAVQITFIFGTTLIDSFSIIGVILIFSGFFSFYSLFRRILGYGWPSIIAMFFFSVSVDVIAQTHCVIQENMALTFLALILIVILNLLREKTTYLEYSLVLPILTVVLSLTHHLTTFFAAFFTLSVILASILHSKKTLQAKGVLTGAILSISFILLLLLLNPLISILFTRYFYLTVPALVGGVVLTLLIYFTRRKIWQIFERIKHDSFKVPFIILGIIGSLGFFFITIFFYPYNRPLLWVVIKFGLFSILFGLSITVLQVLPWFRIKNTIAGLFVFFSILILGISFSVTSIATIVYTSLDIIRVELALSYRHFTFLLIPFAIASSIAIYRVKLSQRISKMSFQRLLLPSLTVLLLIFSSVGIYNLYVPFGGWYPEWCDQAEINAGMWLTENANHNSSIATDRRLMKMVSGLSPIDSTKFNVVWLNLSCLSNPQRILDDLDIYTDSVYFFTSSLSQSHFIYEFLSPPLSIDWSITMNQATSVVKIYARYNAVVYWLTS